MLRGAGGEYFGGAFAIDRFFVGAVDERALDDLLALGGGDGRELAARRTDEGALDDAGRAVFIEQRDERFADAELGDDFATSSFGILAEGFGGGFARLFDRAG